MGSKKSRVCLIGCGPSGMSVLYHFSQMAPKDMPDIVCYEKQATWGGQWNLTWRTGTDEYGEPVHSSLYDNLWINIPKEVMEYPDFTFKEFCGRAVPSYTPASFIRKYIEARMTHGTSPDLKRHIRFSTVVRGVKYDKYNDEFIVSAHDLVRDQDMPEERFTHVVVANGIFSTPNVPYFPGIEQFKGRILHSHDFRQSQEFKGDRILVIGDSNSAQDLALQTMKFGAAKVICSCTKPMALKWPKGIEERSIVQKFDNNTAYFKDGSSAEIDVVLFCTGYQLHFPFLTDDLRLKSDLSYYPDNLYKGIVWMKGGNGKLLYTGVQNQRYTFPMFEAQAFWICRYITGGIMFPSKQNMQKDIELWRKRCSQIKTVPDDIEFQAIYITDLCGMAGYPWRLADARDMYNEWDRHRFADIGKFRDHQFASLYTGTMASSLDTSWMHIYDDRDKIFSFEGYSPSEDDTVLHGAKVTPSEGDTVLRGAKVTLREDDTVLTGAKVTPSEDDTALRGAKVTPSEDDTVLPGAKVTPSEADTALRGAKVTLSEGDTVLRGAKVTPNEKDTGLPGAKATPSEGGKVLPGAKVTPSEGDTALIGAKVTPSEGGKVLPGAKVTPSEVDTALRGVKVTPSEGGTVLPGAKVTPSEGDTAFSGAKVSPSEGGKVLPGAKVTPSEGDSALSGAKVTPSEGGKVLPGAKFTPSEVDTALSGAKVTPSEGGKVFPGAKATPSDVDTALRGAKITPSEGGTVLPGAKVTPSEGDTALRGVKAGGKRHSPRP